MVREESHLDDMRAAIRRDFERLEERRGEQELMRPAAERTPEAQAPAEPLSELPTVEPEPDSQPAPIELVVEAAKPSLQQTVASDDSTEHSGSPPKRSWLDRLLGR